MTLTASHPPRLLRPPRHSGGLSAREALLLARALEVRPGAEWVPLADIHGRRLAAPVTSLHDLPPGPGSAMDGWAVRAGDTGSPMIVAGESAAGHAPSRELGPGEAWRISTGALLPAGADAVVRREHGHEAGGRLVADREARPGANVRTTGEELARGEALLEAGAVVAAHEVGVIAAAGRAGAMCRRRPVVALATTGDELVPPGAAVPAGHRIESNAAGLAAQAWAAGGAPAGRLHIPDERRATAAALACLLEDGPDVLVTVGGISVGDHDHVGAALDRLGARWAFRGVAMRPGHPVALAVIESTVVLALPGNPAAAAVGFHLLGRALLGAREDWSRTAILTTPRRRHARATMFVRCAEDGAGVRPLARQGSAQPGSLAGARALAWIEPGDGVVEAGGRVPVSAMP